MIRKKLTVGTIDPVLYVIALNTERVVARVRVTESILSNKSFCLFIYEADDETEKRLEDKFFDLKKKI